MTASTSSYIDLEKLTASEFSSHVHANTLVLSTNNASDPNIDLTTPLSKALFDLQEIDSNIHTLTSRSALDILKFTSAQNAAANRIIAKVEEERAHLNASYARLEKEILGQYTKATNAKLHAERSHQLLKLGRNVQRVLNLARQFEILVSDSGLNSTNTPATGRSTATREDHRAILQATYMILTFRELITANEPSDLSKINLVRTIRGRIFEDGEARILDCARRIIREFAVSSLTATTGSTFKEAEEAKTKFTSAAHILYLLSPAPQVNGQKLSKKDFEAEYLIRALQGYLQTAITSSSAGIARALGQLPTLDRALLEVSARCQNVVALEALLRTISPPTHPLLAAERPNDPTTNINANKKTNKNDDNDDDDDGLSSDSDEDNNSSTSDSTHPTTQTDNLLTLLLESLDTSSLPSYFWRSLASQLSSRVQEILNRGGIVARTLRSNREEVRSQIRDCVLRGSRMPANVVTNVGGNEQVVGNWEREAAVMAGSVVGLLGK